LIRDQSETHLINNSTTEQSDYVRPIPSKVTERPRVRDKHIKIVRCIVKVKVKEVHLYSAFIVVPHTQGAITQCSHSDHTVLPVNYTEPATCLYLVSIHQMAHPQTEVADIQLQPTTHLSTPTG